MSGRFDELTRFLRKRFLARKSAVPEARFVAAVAGGVAAGKSTFAGALREAMQEWPERPLVTIIPTDGFLLPNRVLAERGLSMRKGFPESYDVEALAQMVDTLESGADVAIPLYSHVTYDVDPSNTLDVRDADIAILDGLHLARLKEHDGRRLIDSLIYLDAEEASIAQWFAHRLVPLMRQGRTDPSSFYYAFRSLDDAGIDAFVDRVWREINLPNLRDCIVHDRTGADIVVHKGADHAIAGLRFREEVRRAESR